MSVLMQIFHMLRVSSITCIGERSGINFGIVLYKLTGYELSNYELIKYMYPF